MIKLKVPGGMAVNGEQTVREGRVRDYVDSRGESIDLLLGI